MNIPSTAFHVEVAKVGESFVVRVCWTQGAGSVGGETIDVIDSRDTLIKCIGVLVNHVPK